MSQYYRHLIQQGLLLDTYPNASVAYSLRRLRSAYNGNVIRVRRDGDNVEQDFGFNGDFVDTASIVSFVGENKFTYSQDISNIIWTKTNLNTTGTPPYLDVVTAPDGTTTADKMIDTATSTIHRISRSASMIVGLTYNVSVYLKAGERTFCQIQSNITGSNQIMNVNLSTGAIISNTFTDARLTSVGSGWYRFDATSVAGVTSTTALFVSMQLTSGGSTTYLGDGTSGMYIWGAQFTQTSTVQTYLSTTATAGGSGWITTWYDQSGNGVNSTQTTAGFQSQIVGPTIAGKVPEILKDPTTGKVSTLWTSDFYNLTSNIATTQKMMHVFVFNRINTSTYIIGLGATNAPVSMVWLLSASNNAVQSHWGTLVTHFTADAGTGAFLTTTLRDGSNVAKMWKNGVAGATGTSANSALNFNYFGKYTSPQNSGWVNEMILWKEDYESVRTGIETNINNYYGIY